MKKFKPDTYYWIKFPDKSALTIGHYEGPTSGYPWTVVASDEIYHDGEFEVICEIQEPPRSLVKDK